ncbi:unnamed protein product [Lampetra planeri]
MLRRSDRSSSDTWSPKLQHHRAACARLGALGGHVAWRRLAATVVSMKAQDVVGSRSGGDRQTRLARRRLSYGDAAPLTPRGHRTFHFYRPRGVGTLKPRGLGRYQHACDRNCEAFDSSQSLLLLLLDQ